MAKVGLQLDENNKYRNSTSAFIRDRISKCGRAQSITDGQECNIANAVVTVYFSTHAHTHTEISRVLFAHESEFLKKAGNLAGGFMAGMSGVIFNCPGDVVRTVVQKKGFAIGNLTGY